MGRSSDADLHTSNQVVILDLFSDDRMMILVYAWTAVVGEGLPVPVELEALAVEELSRNADLC